MKGYRFVTGLGFFTGITFMVLGVSLVVGGSVLASKLNSALNGTSQGLRTASSAIRSVTHGVSNSTGLVENTRISLESTAEIVTGTAVVIEQTVDILAEMRIILPALADDMVDMPLMVRSLMPENHFEEVAARTETVSNHLGLLNTELVDLSEEVTETGISIAGVASSVSLMEEDLLSAEGSFGEAVVQMESIATTIEDTSYANTLLVLSVGLGILLFLTGLYQISSGMMMRKLAKGLAVK